MANPVMNSIQKDWSAQSQTPAGYPTMPGYQPAAQQAPNPYGGQANPYAAQQGQAYGQQGAYGMPQEQAYGQQGAYGDQMASYEAMMNAPAADAVDRGHMTYDDVVVKSLMCFGLLVAGAVVGWMTGVIVPGLAMLTALGLCAVTLCLGLFVRFSKKVRPGAIIAYSLLEGFVLGALSFAFETLYPGIEIVGTRNGFFSEKDEPAIIEEIRKAKPDLLLAALGVPKQEKWLYAHKDELGVPVSIGVGGTLDVMAGVMKRAPRWMQKAKLEWLFRGMLQPKRAGRLMALPKFVLKVHHAKK